MTQRDWQKDMEMCEEARETEIGLTAFRELGVGGPMMAAYWLQEAKERGEREQRLKEAVEEALKWTWYHGEANMNEIDAVLNDILATLYPDTPAPKEGVSDDEPI